MDTMKLLLGTIIALLLAALVMSWNGMNRKVAATPEDEVARLREQISAIRSEQQRQALERQYVKGGSVPVAPPIESVEELQSIKDEMAATQAQLAALEAAKLQRDDKLSDSEQLELDKRKVEKDNAEMRRARLVNQALLIATVSEYVEDPQYGGFATIQILMPDQVQQDTILAIRRNSGILGQLKVTTIQGTEAIASPLPGFGPVVPLAGDELILPPRL